MLHTQSASTADLAAGLGEAAALSLVRSGVELHLTRWHRLQEPADVVALVDVPVQDLDLLTKSLAQQTVEPVVSVRPAAELLRLWWAARYVATIAVAVTPALTLAAPVTSRLVSLQAAIGQAEGELAALPPGMDLWATVLACGLVGAAAGATRAVVA